jgi:uncharacterized protein CbrC (UPF0167 family)
VAIPYGYLRDPNEKSRWILDEVAAPIVQRIFRSVIDGKSLTQIADGLTAEGVLTPTAHWQSIDAGMRNWPNANPTRWSVATIIQILKKQEYMGWCVLNKTVKETYKSKRKKAAPEDMLIFKDAHPQIVDEETWTVVQRLRETRRRPERIGGEPNPLTGILHCADCGHKMYHKQGKNSIYHNPHNEYCCSSYRHYTRSCTMHYIRAAVIENMILEAIRRVSGYVRKNEAEFVKRVRDESALQQEAAVKESKRKMNQSQRRRDEVSVLIKKLYESYANEKIPEQHFAELLAEYGAERNALDGEIAKLQDEVDNYNNDTVRADKFIELVKRHTEFTEFSAVLLNEFVEKVIVHEAVKIEGVRTQDVEIFFTFIGKFDLPETAKPESAQEEQKPARKSRTDRDREYDRIRYARKRDARIAAEQAERAAILKGTSYAV